MPFVARYASEIRPGTVVGDIVLNVDFASTFLASAGATVPATMHGRSFRKNCAGRAPQTERLARKGVQP